ncbi:10405_t:CDS:2 [Entrophospora sp. SA101]|nr:10405_t:CDS:2 [Entrophospora sp. SA101]
MPRPTKSKSSYKNQIRNPDGTFYSRKLNKGKEIDYFSESTLGNVAELDNDNFLGEVLENEVELALFSNCTALFAFDNSTNHGSYKSDALVASRMNLNPGGKQPKMKDTVFGPNNIFQSMVFEDGIPKGMKQVLVERNLWKEDGPTSTTISSGRAMLM